MSTRRKHGTQKQVRQDYRSRSSRPIGGFSGLLRRWLGEPLDGADLGEDREYSGKADSLVPYGSRADWRGVLPDDERAGPFVPQRLPSPRDQLWQAGR
jgi:hypothetical protein